MGIVIKETADLGIWRQTVEGLPLRVDYARRNAHLQALIATGTLTGLLVDARQAEMHPHLSTTKEIWLDGLEVLSGLPVAYFAPPHHKADRQIMIQQLADEWNVSLRLFECEVEARTWLLHQIAARAQARASGLAFPAADEHHSVLIRSGCWGHG